MRVRPILVVAAALLASRAIPAHADVIYVDDDAPPGGDGTSWATAFRFFQDALVGCPTGAEFRIGQGVYLPDRSEANPTGTGDRFARFACDTVYLLGGWAGYGAPDPDDRDFDRFVTILSADLEQDDGPGFDNRSDNAFDILEVEDLFASGLTFWGATETAIDARIEVDMVDCRLEENEEGLDTCGGYVRRCVFSRNGRAIFAYDDGLVIKDSTFIRNFNTALWLDELAHTVERCVFVGNSSRGGGGAIRSTYVSSDEAGSGGGVQACIFIGNSAARGGAVCVNGANYPIIDCLFAENTASQSGGAVQVEFTSETIQNCTFRRNSAPEGSSVALNAVGGFAMVDIVNCIVWDERAIGGAVDRVTLDYCNVLEPWSGAGTGLISEGPRHVALAHPGGDGIWGTTDDDLGDYRLNAESPCIDRGTNNVLLPQEVDLAGDPRHVNFGGAADAGQGEAPIIDMGSYEYQVVSCPTCVADLDCDGTVTVNDLCVWHQVPCDLNRDGVIDEVDALVIADQIEPFEDCNDNGMPDSCEGAGELAGVNPPGGFDHAPDVPVAIAGDVALLGSYLDDDAGEDAGAVHVMFHDGATWLDVQNLLGQSEGDEFGRSVAADGGYAIVGADHEDSAVPNGGAVYLYRWTPYAVVREKKITASDAANGDNLGRVVSISGEVALASAHRDGNGRGAAYVITRTESGWVETQKLQGSGTAAGDRFGLGLAIRDDLAIIGADRHDAAGDQTGAAFVFRSIGGAFVEEQKLLAPDAVADHGFGRSVGIDATWAAVGAYLDDETAENAGAVWMYRYDEVAEMWLAHGKVMAEDGAVGDWFGRAVALRGDTLVVGARYHDEVGTDAGASYTYRFDADADTWVRAMKTTSPDGPGSLFGTSVDVAPTRAMIGTAASPSPNARVLTQLGAADVDGNGVPDDCQCPADLDGSGAVDVGDLLIVLGAWSTPDGDVTGDGTTDVADLLAVLGAWGSCH